jgi:hypothetical protein
VQECLDFVNPSGAGLRSARDATIPAAPVLGAMHHSRLTLLKTFSLLLAGLSGVFANPLQPHPSKTLWLEV